MSGRALHQECLIDPPEPRFIRYPGGGGGEVLHVDRFGEKVFGPQLHRSHRGRDIRLTRKQHHRGIPLPQVLQHLHAIHARKPQIQNDDFWP
jgi:hypothetical protein